MMWLLTAAAFFLLLTLIVIVHELGHYAAARWSGVTVEEFGFGLPPRAKSLFRWRGTLFSLNWIPVGGFVRLQGDNSLDSKERERKGSFSAASIPARLTILVAGVFMNLVVAVLLFMLGFWMWKWVPTYLTEADLREAGNRGEVHVSWGLYVVDVPAGTPAESANIEKGGVLVKVDGKNVTTVDEILALQLGKHSVTYTLLYSDASVSQDGAFHEERTALVSLKDGKSGVAISPFAFDVTGVRRTLIDGVRLSLRESLTVMEGTVRGVGLLLKSLMFEQKVPNDIAGIVGIAQLTHISVLQGFMKYVRLIALLSLSLAALNIFPFPALDGGRIFFVLYELIAHRPVNRRFEVVTNGVGIVLIMALMVAVTWNDIVRILSSPPIS